MRYLINDRSIKCSCGSGLSTEDIYDSNGNFIVRVCTMCKERKLTEIMSLVTEESHDVAE